MPSSHLILCRPLLLLPPIPPSISVFSSESTLPMRWPKYWSFNLSISPSSEHPGPISFGMNWLDLLAVQGTLKSLLQHHSSKASILGLSAFFTVQLSHPYMTTGKTIALTRRTFVSKVMWHNKIPQTRVLINRNLLSRSSQAGSPDQGVCRSGFFWGFSARLLLCPHMAFPEFMRIPGVSVCPNFLSYKVAWLDKGPPLRPHFNLVISLTALSKYNQLKFWELGIQHMNFCGKGTDFSSK